MSNSNAEPQTPANELALRALGGVAVIIILVAVPSVILPTFVTLIFSDRIATKWRYWQTFPYWWAVVAGSLTLFAGVMFFEVRAVALWVGDGSASTFFGQPRAFYEVWPPELTFEQVWANVAPWLILNVLLGLLLLPAVWSLQRRRTARRVRLRHISDVVRQDNIEDARKVASDMAAARAIGVKVNIVTGEITGLAEKNVMYAPLEVGERQAIGVVNKPTIRNVIERLHDQRKVPDWLDSTGTYCVVPDGMSMFRALLLAESGSGKTVLLNDIILAALKSNAKVIFIDGKGVPDDAEKLVALARSNKRSATRALQWNLFNGTSTEITEKLMRLLPQGEGGMQHYISEQRGVLQAVQSDTPLASVEDLARRLRNPEKYVSNPAHADVVNKQVSTNPPETAGTRALQSLLVALNPLAEHISVGGWSYNNLPADLTVVSLTPVDTAQAKVGELMLTDLRNYLANRMKTGDMSPVLVIVDEFPQLVAANTDPSDEAAMLFETCRSVGVGLILAAQSTAGLSKEEVSRRRILTSGAAVIIGRSKDPEEAVKLAGTMLRLEATGAAMGDELNAGRSQHTYVLPPQDVRRAPMGKFWIIQAGAYLTFRAMPTRKARKREVEIPPVLEDELTVNDMQN